MGVRAALQIWCDVRDVTGCSRAKDRVTLNASDGLTGHPGQ